QRARALLFCNRLSISPHSLIFPYTTLFRSPRADYIDCPVGDLNDGAGGSFDVAYTVPAGAATASPNNIVNNGDYDIRASTLSPFIAPLVKTTILPAATPTVDLGTAVDNGRHSAGVVGGPDALPVTVTYHWPARHEGAGHSQH